jgi:hypothetical protein
MNREAIQSVLQQPYQRDRWLEVLRAVLPGTDVFTLPQPVQTEPSRTDSILQLGRVRLHGGNQLAVLEVGVGGEIQVTRNRVGLRNLVARLIDQAEYHGILAVFNSSKSSDYRFTFAARQSVFDPEGDLTERETAPRRYTYVLGPNETCRTAAERFSQLAAKAHGAELGDVVDAFSVEKLNTEFFADFCRAFGNVRDEITRRYRWVDATVKSEAQTLLNRLLFLYFVQRKGWLNRQRDYLILNFRSGHENNPKATSYHTLFLRPLFERLSTEETTSLLSGHDLPFLNGGLFSDEYGNEQLDPQSKRRKELTLSNETFGYIFERLLEPYNFTIHEDSPNNYEVAIDPEMLGRIFEALVLQSEESDAGGKSARHDSGSHYTPRPIVHYICRDTLAAWLGSQQPFAKKETSAGIDELLKLDVTEGIDEEIRQRLGQCLTPDEAAALRDRLFELRACDPAVGSGAFPMGLLHELINLVRLCETRARGKDPVERDPKWLYDTKKRIIERVLYGVDNQERAIEICKLRLWLSLMVDHELDVDPENCEARAFGRALKALDPLPNLEFKIRRANSLVDYIHGEPVNLGSPDSGDQSHSILTKLIVAKQDFYAARSKKDKRRLRFVVHEATAELAQIEFNWARNRMGLFADQADAVRIAELERAQKEMASVLGQIRAARKAKVAEQDEVLEQLQEWFDDSGKPTFVWQLDFAEVFHRHDNGERSSSSFLLSEVDGARPGKPVRNGFDIVIGNPPYVRIQTLMKTDPTGVAYYKENYTSARKGNYDIYVVFVERGLEILDGRYGQLGYVLPHKFFNAQYGEPLRKLISKGKHLRHVVHFGDQQIFPGATNYVCLLFLSSSSVEKCRFMRADDLKLWLATQRGIVGDIWSERIDSAVWNFTVGKDASLFEYLTLQPVKLRDVVNFFVGLQTSADTVYLFKESKPAKKGFINVYSKEVDQTVQIESDLLKRVVRSGSIGRYRAEATALLLFPYEIRSNKARLYTPDEMRRNFPLAWEYLGKNKRMLEDREEGSFKGDQWYRFGRSQNLGVWEQPKLLVPYMVAKLGSYLDAVDELYFVNVTTGGYGLTIKDHQGSLSYLCGLLNSSVLDFFFKRVSTTFHGGYFAANKQFIEQLPIPSATANQRIAIEQLVDLLLWLHQQSSVAGSDPTRPQDPAMASFFEQTINALVYELFFAEELHLAGLRVFDLLNNANLPDLDSLPDGRESRLQALFDLFQRLRSPGNPLRIALDKLQTLDLVRIVEDKP